MKNKVTIRTGSGAIDIDFDQHFDGKTVRAKLEQTNINIIDITEVEVHEGITDIGHHGAFERFRNLKKITLPFSLQSIGHMGFRFCQNLESIIFKNPNMHTYGDLCFAFCPSLRNVALPNRATQINLETMFYASSNIAGNKDQEKTSGNVNIIFAHPLVIDMTGYDEYRQSLISKLKQAQQLVGTSRSEDIGKLSALLDDLGEVKYRHELIQKNIAWAADNNVVIITYDQIDVYLDPRISLDDAIEYRPCFTHPQLGTVNLRSRPDILQLLRQAHSLAGELYDREQQQHSRVCQKVTSDFSGLDAFDEMAGILANSILSDEPSSATNRVERQEQNDEQSGPAPR